MTLDDIADNLIGEWTGENILHLSWTTPPEYHSTSTLSAAKAVGGKFLAINYTWEHENEAHEGLLLAGFDKKLEIANASWVDSWHSSDRPITLAGRISDSGKLDLLGSYEVPNSPNWLWRIVITPNSDALQIQMYNGSPEGAEDLAVQSDYRRI